MSKEKKIHIVKSVIKHGLLLCVGFFWIYPFLWMISASFKGQNEFFQNRMGLIPVQPTIDNFIRIWQKADFGTYQYNYCNSIFGYHCADYDDDGGICYGTL